MININYKKAILRPFTDYKKFLIGIVLLFIPIINILTGFIVKGFQLECAKDERKKKYELPDFNDFKRLFVIGFLSFVISIIYLIPVIIIFAVSIGNLFLDMIKSMNAEEIDFSALTASIGSGEITGIVIGSILLVLTMYIVPVALMEYLNKYKFKQAFKINTILKKVFTGKYFITILSIIGYFIVVYAVSSLIMLVAAFIPSATVIQVIASVISAIINFILGVTAFTLIGEVYPELK